MAFLTLLTGLACRRRVDPLPLLSAIALLVVAMAGMVVLRPDLFNYSFFVLWLIILERARRQPGRSGSLAALIGVEILWVNSHPLFFYYGLALGVSCRSSSSARPGKIRLPWPGKREVTGLRPPALSGRDRIVLAGQSAGLAGAAWLAGQYDPRRLCRRLDAPAQGGPGQHQHPISFS